MRTIARALLVVLLVLHASSDHLSAGAALTALAQRGANLAVAPIAADTIRIGVLKGGAYDVVSLPMEAYVARVLAGEAAPQSPPAALEALAIAIRTYTVTNRRRHGSEGFDLCDQTHCQVMRDSTLATERAALATAEQILLYRGAPATVFYSASCGGRSEKPSNVWPGADDPAYLFVHDDDGCGGFPVWSAELADTDLQRALLAGGFTGTLRDVKVLTRNESGRVARLELDGLTPREISGQELRMVVGRSLGFQHLQSTQFELRRAGRAFRFTGRGAGHGVGLCVIGSMKLASGGQSAATILARYFPGTEIAPYGARLTSAPREEPSIASPRPDRSAAVRPTVPPPPVSALPFGVTVALTAVDAAERSALGALVERERQAMALTLGVDAPLVRVRVHESGEAYERATGQPWFTLGAIAGDELQLVPLALLRERGMLERTVRRQIAHLIVDAVLPAKPAWIRDGAAVYYADPEAPAPARQPCPQDADLRRPVSIGSLGDAFARARVCFERQISGGRDWRRVR